MKKLISKSMAIAFILLGSLLAGSNICCTGHAANHEKQATASTDNNVITPAETNTGVVTALTASTFDENIKSGIVLVDFWATWCNPCKIQSPIIEDVSTVMAGKVSVFKLDVDQNSSIAKRYNVQSIPTMIIFKDGKAVGQFVGITQKEDIINAIEKFSTK